MKKQIFSRSRAPARDKNAILDKQFYGVLIVPLKQTRQRMQLTELVKVSRLLVIHQKLLNLVVGDLVARKEPPSKYRK